MALNITFDGFVYLEDGALADGDIIGRDVRYQAYFYQNGTASSPSQWNNVRLVEGTLSAGYYNFNLGDGDFLTQDGTALNGSIVLVAFWIGDPRGNTDCAVLGEWAAFEITLDGSSTYTNPAQTKGNICPNLIWSFPTDGLINTNYSSTNSSNDVHSWTWMGTTMYHWYTRYGETIHAVNKVDNTDYDWDDGDTDLNLPGAAIGTHSWSSSGDYDIEIVIEDVCGCTVTGTETIRIKNPGPTPDIICNQAVGQNVEDPDTVVTFEYAGTNPGSVITAIDWVIEDDTNTVVTGLAASATVPHTNGEGTSWYGHTASPGAFTDPGTHNVSIVVYWWDGFTTQTTTYDEDFYQLRFSGPSVDFTQDPDPVPVSSGVEFTNTTTDPDSRVGTAGAGEQYDWTWDDDGTIDTVNDVAHSYVYSNTPNSEFVDITLCAHWNDGWDDYQACETKSVAIETSVVITKNQCYYELEVFGTSDDGTVSDYQWTISRSTVSGSASGPWEVLWTSPKDIDQKQKTICFTEINYFKIEAEVFGSGATTSDYQLILPEEICSDAECSLIIWNGTGILDVGGDWNHNGHGTEAAYAKYEGTNGLDATGFTNGKKIRFQDPNENNVDNYDLLSMRINLQEWMGGSNISVYFEDGNSVVITDYLQTLNTNQWQRVIIPLEDFGLTAPINLRRLTLESLGTIGMYVDNVEFVVGATIRGVIDVGRPEMEAEDTNRPVMGAGEIDLRPNMGAFPPPGNLI